MSTVVESKKRSKAVPTHVFGKIYRDVVKSGGKKADLFRALNDAGYEMKHQSLGSKLQALANLLKPTNEFIIDEETGERKMKNQTVDILPKLADYGEGKGRRIDKEAVEDLRNDFADLLNV